MSGFDNLELCPTCGGKVVAIARNMRSTRTCVQGHQWDPPPRVAPTPERSGDVEVRIPVSVCQCGAWCAGHGPGTDHKDAQELVSCECEPGTPWATYWVTATLARPTPQPAREARGDVSDD